MSTAPHGPRSDTEQPGRCPLRSEAVPLYREENSADFDALWERLRRTHSATAPVELEPGVVMWLLLGYQENLDVLRNPHLYSRDTRLWREAREGRFDLTRGRPTLSWRRNALYVDGEEHQRLRAPIVDGLARVHEPGFMAGVRELADGLIDGFVADGKGDLITQYAGMLPVLVLNRLFGLDDAYGYMLGELSTRVWDSDSTEATEAAHQLKGYFAGLVERKRAHPGEDVTSWLLRHPAGLTDEEAVNQLFLMSAAGHEPTTHLIGNTLRLLLTDGELAHAYGGSQLSTSDLLDHVMWTDPPFHTLAGRFTTQRVRIGGRDIAEGEGLLIGLGPAHADPAVTDHVADTPLWPTAGNRAHLMWGAGPHGCPAQNIARHIAAIGVSSVINRLAGLRLAVSPGELRRRPSPFTRGLRGLPVVFPPARPLRPESVWPAPETEEPAEEPAPSEGPTDEREESDEGDQLNSLLRWWLGV